MTSLQIHAQGISAVRQIRSLARAGVLMPNELERLLKKIDEALALDTDPEPDPIVWSELQGRERLGAVQGGQL